LGAFDLARVSVPPTAASAVAARITVGGSNGCPTTSGAGCAYAAANRSLGTVSLGGLPAAQIGDTVPAGFASLVSISGLSETARAEAGAGERSPTYTRAGTLSYWNGLSMTGVLLSAVATPSTIDPPAVTALYPGSAGTVTVTADPLVTIGSTTGSSTGALPCTSQQCSRSQTGSTITVTVVYAVTAAGAQTTRFALSATLGTVIAQATYRGAPSA
jgi:hypothetical protein